MLVTNAFLSNLFHQASYCLMPTIAAFLFGDKHSEYDCRQSIIVRRCCYLNVISLSYIFFSSGYQLWLHLPNVWVVLHVLN
jgi:hypothetical protein